MANKSIVSGDVKEGALRDMSAAFFSTDENSSNSIPAARDIRTPAEH